VRVSARSRGTAGKLGSGFAATDTNAMMTGADTKVMIAESARSLASQVAWDLDCQSVRRG
jgi:hypothetical protein